MEIRVRLKNIYGEDKIYPVCPQSKLFANLAKTKTLTKQTLIIIEKLGYEITIFHGTDAEYYEKIHKGGNNE